MKSKMTLNYKKLINGEGRDLKSALKNLTPTYFSWYPPTFDHVPTPTSFLSLAIDGIKVMAWAISGSYSFFPGIFHVYMKYAMLCYAKSLQLCLTLCDPRDGSPPGSPIPGILQARTLEWVAISFSNA